MGEEFAALNHLTQGHPYFWMASVSAPSSLWWDSVISAADPVKVFRHTASEFPPSPPETSSPLQPHSTNGSTVTCAALASSFETYVCAIHILQDMWILELSRAWRLVPNCFGPQRSLHWAFLFVCLFLLWQKYKMIVPVGFFCFSLIKNFFMSVCVCLHACLVSMEGKQGHMIPWKWN